MEFEIRLDDLLFYAFHGVMQEERSIGNEFTVSLSVRIPFQKDMEHDQLEKTVNYDTLFRIIKTEMGIPRNLMETVALSIAKAIREKYPQTISGKITIRKNRPPVIGMLGTASVSLSF